MFSSDSFYVFVYLCSEVNVTEANGIANVKLLIQNACREIAQGKVSPLLTHRHNNLHSQ